MQQYLNLDIQLLLVDIDTWSNPFVASRVFWTCFYQNYEVQAVKNRTETMELVNEY